MEIALRLLRSFVQIHEPGSISRAAGRMGFTAAAIPDDSALGWPGRAYAGIFAALRGEVALTPLAAGAAPADLAEFVEAPGLPAFGSAYSLAGPGLRQAARQVKQRLINALALVPA